MDGGAVMGNPLVQKNKTPRPPAKGRFKEIGVILLFALGIFVWLSLHTESVGLVGMWVSRYTRWLLGFTADLPVLFLFFAGYVCLKGIDNLPEFRRLITGIILLIGVILIQVHLQTTDIVAVSYVQRLGPGATRPQGAGAIGQLLTALSLRALGLGGTYVLSITCALIAVILLFEVPLFKNIGRGVKWLAGNALKPGQYVAGLLRKAYSLVGSWHSDLKASSTRRRKSAQNRPAKRKVRRERQAAETTLGEVAAAGEEKPQVAENDAKADEVVVMPSVVPRKVDPFSMPGADLLGPIRRRQVKNTDTAEERELLEETLASFGIDGRVVDVCQGPTVTRYEIQPPAGVKVSRIVSLADDLALALAAADVRIEAPVPGKSVVGVEVPNKEASTVFIQEVLGSKEFQSHPSRVAMALGKDIAGKTVVADLAKLPHLLVAGATGSGKSICLNVMIASFLYKSSPEEVQLLLIDPKRVELGVYNGIPHLVSPVVIDPKKAATALRWAVREMERRYELFAESGARNIQAYNDWVHENHSKEDSTKDEQLPYIVIIIDELADLMLVAAADVEDAICRLAQMARAAGMYLIIATQRPSVDVITGLIKANIPSRLAFAVSSQVDSRTILDMAGAERLLGKGDMLYYPSGAPKALRAQGAFIQEKDIAKIVEFWKKQADPKETAVADIIEEQETVDNEVIVDDELFDDAVQLIIDSGQASISMLQRRFRIGYSRAARLIDTMELKGIVGPHQGSKPREVLIDHYEGSQDNG
ncbi:MAG: DNA translocase FtsK [Firmicutes bacterium]|nr:DNA translocase FtsK [Bacillota bacterium]